MKVQQKVAIIFSILLFGAMLFAINLPAQAARQKSYTHLKELIEKAQDTRERQNLVRRADNGTSVKSSKKTVERIITFRNKPSPEEIKSIELKYDLELVEKSTRRPRYIVTPKNEEYMIELSRDSRVKDISNYDKETASYKVSAQTVDWGIEKMNIPTAWNNPTPNNGTGIVIALIDSGVQLDHPDLAGVFLAGGHDYVNNDEDPTDDLGHGTFMAGAIAAANNSIGSQGASFGAKILPMKVCGVGGSCDSIAIADAIDDAVAANVDIINLSLGGEPNDLILNAVQNATNAGIIVVAAAGNETQEGCLYPAGYENVVCVGSTTNTDQKASFSNYGSTLDVVTPGQDILSTGMGNTYALVSGTSISTAYYSGAAALVKSMIKDLCIAEPTNVACADKRTYTQLLLNEVTVRDIGTPGKDANFGNGIVDLSQIFTETTTVHTTPTSLVKKGTTYAQPVTVTNNNSYAISITGCTVMSKNNMRTQTVPSFATVELLKGATHYVAPVNNILYTTFSFPTPIPVIAGGSVNFSYSYLLASEAVTNDTIKYSFVCNFDNSESVALENYRTEAKTSTSTVILAVPEILTNAYFTFGKLKYNQTIPSSQLRAYDMVYLKNFDTKKLKLTQFFLYDYIKKGNQGFTKTWKTSTSFSLRTDYLLPSHRKYAYVAEFQEIASGTKIKKYFVFYTK